MIINSSEIRLQNNSLEPQEKPYLLLIERFYEFKGAESFRMKFDDIYGFLNVVAVPIEKHDERKFKIWNDVANISFATALPTVIKLNLMKELI